LPHLLLIQLTERSGLTSPSARCDFLVETESSASQAQDKMANTAADQFNKLNESVKVISGNLDQLFIIFMGCLVFCKYYYVLLF